MAFLKHARQQSRDHQTILEGVAQPQRHGGAVAEHRPLAIAIAADDRRSEMQPAAIRHGEALAASQKPRIGKHQLRGHEAFAKHMLRAVEVGQQGVEHASTLVDAHLEVGPVCCGDHQRDRVEHPRSLRAAGLVVDVVSDTVVVNQPAGLVPSPGKFRRLPAAEEIDQPPPVWPWRAIRPEQFVVGIACGKILIKGRRGAGER